MNLQTAYTPQMVVDGYVELKGTSADIEQTFAKELKAQKYPCASRPPQSKPHPN